MDITPKTLFTSFFTIKTWVKEEIKIAQKKEEKVENKPKGHSSKWVENGKESKAALFVLRRTII